MNRLTKAWKALRGTLEPEVREVVRIEKQTDRIVAVGDSFQSVYRVYSRKHKEAMRNHEHALELWRISERYRHSMIEYGGKREPAKACPVAPEPPEWEGRVYLTCADAFQAHGEDATTEQVKAFVANGKAYIIGWLTEVEIQPKPKRPKGRA